MMRINESNFLKASALLLLSVSQLEQIAGLLRYPEMFKVAFQMAVLCLVYSVIFFSDPFSRKGFNKTFNSESGTVLL